MTALAWFIFGFALTRFFIAAVNFFGLQRFPENPEKSLPFVSVLIPARNEEKNITTLLSDLQQQKYPNLEIIVFNDHSEDETAEIVARFVGKDPRIKLVNSMELPAGWLGKNHACFQLAKQAGGRYFLFLDADVRISGDIISKTVALTEKHGLGLLSIFPGQIMKTFGEWITVPNMNYILLTLLPLILVRKTRFASLAAANGQFMFFNAETYRKFQPHEKMKSSKVEDILIARYLKKNNVKIACLTGNDEIQCRMYSGFAGAVNGFSKNVAQFFGNSLLAAFLFWAITSFGWAVIFIYLPVPVFFSFLGLALATRILVSAVSRQNILKNILTFIPQQFSLGMFIYKAIENKFSKQFQWKGRTITS